MASIKDPSDTHGRLIAADQVEGTTIYNPAGDNLGSVEDVMIDKDTGKIADAEVGFGGLLGIGNRHYPMPWEKLKYDTNMGGFVVDLSSDNPAAATVPASVTVPAGSSSATFAGALVIFCSAMGFTLMWLLTRVYIARLMEAAASPLSSVTKGHQSDVSGHS